MMGAPLRYGLIGGLFFIVGLIVYLPASLVTGWVAGATDLRFDGVTGTALDGKAAYVSLPDGGINTPAKQFVTNHTVRPTSHDILQLRKTKFNNLHTHGDNHGFTGAGGKHASNEMLGSWLSL